MLNFIKMEFLKLKRSKLFLISVLSALIPPILVLITLFEMKNLHPTEAIAFSTFLSDVNLYMLGLFGVLVFCIIVSYLFGREYNEHTLKSLLILPISKIKYLCGKFLMLIIWIMVICSVTFIGAVICAYIGGVSGFTLNVLGEYYLKLLSGGALLFLSMSPFVFISMLMRNLVPAMIGGASVVLVNMMVYGKKYAPFSPWMSPYLISSGELLTDYTIGLIIPSLILIITFIVGFGLSWTYLSKKDVPL